jgi:hypothetical protein
MVERSLPAGFIEAGERYDAALRALGLRPDGLFWAWDKTIRDFVLVLVTRHLDHAGPLELFRLLTRAYNLSATPAEISPFIVRVHSPDQQIIRNLLMIDAFDKEGKRVDYITARGEIADLEYVNHWVYYWPDLKKKKPHPVSRTREWNRFRRTVEQLAA